MTGKPVDKTSARFWTNLFAVAGLISGVFYRSGLRAGRPNSALNRFNLVAMLLTVLSLIGWQKDPRSGQPPEP